VKMSVFAQIQDLTHLVGPFTEENIVSCLQARFYAQQFQVNKVGPVVVSQNCNRHRPSNKALLEPIKVCPLLQDVVKDGITQRSDTGHSQAIIVSGESGSGKTHCAMQLLRQLFDMAGGGCETDTFKHLSASLTVLRSLFTAGTVTNLDSTRVGMFVENFISDMALYRTKIHAFMMDRDRVCNVPGSERNYHIFYQMLAGLSTDGKAKLHLSGYSLHNLRYLSQGNTHLNQDIEDRARFEAWKSSLSVLGIPFSDVMRVFAAVLLLGNIEFVEGAGLELDIIGNNEVKAVAALLGVSGVALYRGFTTRTRNTRGIVCKSLADCQSANLTRDALAKALYCRTVSAILKRANNLCKPNMNANLSGSTDSNLHQGGLSPSHEFGISRSSSICSGQQEPAKPDGFISIIDMLGFETAQVNKLEQLCSNLCAETIQHFYNTHIFKSTMQALQEEEIPVQMSVNYFDNEPILELLSSKRSGVLNLLDIECNQPKSCPEGYVSNLKVHHRVNNFFFEPLPKAEVIFGIRHFAGRVIYDASDFMHSNMDVIPDDIVAVFSKQNCNFGFVSHLFSQELKQIDSGNSSGPKGLKHRVLPNSYENSSDDHHSTLSLDFQHKLDKLLKILLHAKPQFILCLKSNDRGEMDMFDRDVVIRQTRSLQVVETVQLMAGGIPHRMRFKAFNNRYKIFWKHRKPYQLESQREQCKVILNCFLKAMDDSKLPYVSTQWNVGRKHIFYSEQTRQHLEAMRNEKIHNAASILQAAWRGYKCRSVLAEQRSHDQESTCTTVQSQSTSRRSRKTKYKGKDPGLVDKASHYYSINLDSTPSVPPKRTYLINGNFRIGYPHFRIMKDDFPSNGSPGQDVLCRGEEVHVVGPSLKRGHLTVRQRNIVKDVPYHLLDIKSGNQLLTPSRPPARPPAQTPAQPPARPPVSHQIKSQVLQLG
ncbi:hypothetical protein FSP39_025375, partial [Pinctada imbricata]